MLYQTLVTVITILNLIVRQSSKCLELTISVKQFSSDITVNPFLTDNSSLSQTVKFPLKEPNNHLMEKEEMLNTKL